MTHKVNEYPDGTSYVNNVGLKCEPFRINSYEDLWHLNQYVDAFISEHKIYPYILIPSLLDAQADRRFNVGESSGLKLVLKFLEGLPVKEYRIFHPHNPEVVEAFLSNVTILDNKDFILKVLEYYRFNLNPRNAKPVHENLILMSSDAGGFKPLMKLCDKINWEGETFSAAKSRSWDEKDGTKFIQQIERQDFGGKDILIIDDISVYGGTFKGLSKLLKSRNCGNLYLAVSHMTVKNLGEDPVTNYFNKVFTTDSKFNDYLCADNKGEPTTPDNLEVIKMF